MMRFEKVAALCRRARLTLASFWRRSTLRRAMVVAAMICVVIVPAAARAEYVGVQTVKRIFQDTNGMVLLGVATQPPASCRYWDLYFRFDATTPVGKNMLAIVTAALLANRPVDITYGASPAQGQNETNGCGPSNLATAVALGFSAQ